MAQRIVLTFMLLLLAACGSSADEENCTDYLLFRVCRVPVSDSMPAPPPAPEPTGGSSGGAQPDTGSDGSDGTRSVAMAHVNEFEPNSDLNNANPLSFPVQGANDAVGVEVLGTVSDSGDGADFFVFSPPTTGLYLIYLCADTCTEQVVDDAVYIAVYDQSQTTLASTAMGAVERQRLSVEFAAGLTYYVGVHAVGTAAAEYAYRLVIIN
jgi:hypothetical protein